MCALVFVTFIFVSHLVSKHHVTELYSSVLSPEAGEWGKTSISDEWVMPSNFSLHLNTEGDRLCLGLEIPRLHLLSTPSLAVNASQCVFVRMK